MKSRQLSIWSNVFIFICIVSFFAVTALPAVCDGLELLCLIPFFTAMFFMLFCNTVAKTTRYLGIFVIYCVIIVRNCISPLLMALSHSTVYGLYCDSTGYLLAVISNIIETLCVFICLGVLYRRDSMPINSRPSSIDQGKKYRMDISTIGVGFFMLLIAVLVYRGNLGNVFSYISVLGVQNYGKDALCTYDYMCVLTMKTVLCLLFIAFAYKHYVKARNNLSRIFYFAIAFFFGFINIAFYDGTARALLIITAISTVAVLVLLFPRFKGTIIIGIVSVAVIIATMLFLTDTLHFHSAGGGWNISSDSLVTLSNTLETYCNGITNVAYGFSTYETARKTITLGTYFSDIISSIGFNSFPVFRIISNLIADIPNGTQIYRSLCSMVYHRGAGYILPPIIHALYFGGAILAVPLNFLYYYLVLRFQRYLIKKKETAQNIAYVYLLVYFETILGLCLCYDAWIIVRSMTGNGFYLILMVFMNTLGSKLVFSVRKS